MTATKTPRKSPARKPRAAKTPPTANTQDAAAERAAGKHIPEPPKTPFNGADPAAFDHDRDGKPGGSLPKVEVAPVGTPPNVEPAPAYRFEPADEPAAPAPRATEPAQDPELGVTWSDETTPRGRIITASKGKDGPTTTYEEVLPAGASDAQAAAAKERLQKRFAA